MNTIDIVLGALIMVILIALALQPFWVGKGNNIIRETIFSVIIAVCIIAFVILYLLI